MAESWIRLWSGMTTDPKWQTIARKSGQPRALVIALFAHLLLEANESDDRGSLEHLAVDDVASALDCDEEAVEAILAAMDGRVIENGRLSGWERRQPQREDSGDERTGAMSSTARSRLHREKKRTATHGNAMQRDATQCNAPEAEAEAEAEAEEASTSTSEVDTLTAGESEPENRVLQQGPVASEPPEPPPPSRRGAVCRLLRGIGVADAAPHYLTDETWQQILDRRSDEEIVEFAKAKLASRQGMRTGLKYLAPGLLEQPKPRSPPWWASVSAMEAKAREVGIAGARPGEEMEAFKARITAAIRRVEGATA